MENQVINKVLYEEATRDMLIDALLKKEKVTQHDLNPEEGIEIVSRDSHLRIIVVEE